jgi:hypothetical protein
MFSVQPHYPGVDPWAAAPTSDVHYQVSRAAAARHAVMQAVRERRNASRSVRRSPAPALIEPVGEPRTAAGDVVARSDEFAPVG